jgi:hypothetical protein
MTTPRTSSTHPPLPECGREGCTRKPSSEQDYCTALCRLVAREMEKCEDACKRSGVRDETALAWASVTTLSDALTDYRLNMSKVYRLVHTRTS